MFCTVMYLDEYCDTHFSKLIKSIKKQRIEPGLYVIVLSQNTGKLEYFHSIFLKQDFYKIHEPYIIGLANGAESAMNIVKAVLEETYRIRGDFNVTLLMKDKCNLLPKKVKKSVSHIIIRREEGEQS